MQIPNGKYTGTPTNFSITKSAGGALMIGIDFDLLNDGFTGKNIRANQCLFYKNGDQSDPTTEMLKQCFNWPGDNTHWLKHQCESGAMNKIEVELVIEEEAYEDRNGEQKTAARVRYINPIRGLKLKESDPEEAIMAEFGARLRTKAGTQTPASNAAPIPHSAPPSSTPPPSNAPGCTMQEAWDTVNANAPGAFSGDVSQAWKDKRAELFGSKADDALSPQDWHRLKVELEDNIPF
jgi:hypothetical protein